MRDPLITAQGDTVRALLGWLSDIDARVARTRSLVPPPDHPVAVDLWSQMPEEHRHWLQWETFCARPVEDPTDAVVQFALIEQQARRRAAERPRWVALSAAIVVVSVAVPASGLVAWEWWLLPAVVVIAMGSIGMVVRLVRLQEPHVRSLAETRASVHMRTHPPQPGSTDQMEHGQ